MNWSMWLIGILAGLGGAGGVAGIFTAYTNRNKPKAEAAEILTGSAVSLVKEHEGDAKEARDELKAFRREAAAEMASVRNEARALAEELYRLRMAIMAPGATIDSLRLLVAGPQASNGTGP